MQDEGPIHVATTNGHADIMRILIGAKANVDVHDAKVSFESECAFCFDPLPKNGMVYFCLSCCVGANPFVGRICPK